MQRKVIKNIAVILIALGSILAATLLLDRPSQPPAPSNTGPEVVSLPEQAAPDFIFTSLENNQIQKLSAFRGKVVLLNFWASWCAPCVIEFPKLAALATEFKGDLVVIAVSADTEQDDIRRFLKKIGQKPLPNFLISHDEGKAISQDLFQTIRLPETIVIDPKGVMVRKVVGDTDWTGTEMKSYLSGLVEASSIP